MSMNSSIKIQTQLQPLAPFAVPPSNQQQIKNRQITEGQIKAKIYEEQIRKKKEQLYFEFEKREETIRQSQQQLINHNEIQYKHELDRLYSFSAHKSNLLVALDAQLKELIEQRKDRIPTESHQGEPLANSSIRNNFASLQDNSNNNKNYSHKHSSIFSQNYYRWNGMSALNGSEQQNKANINDHIEYIKQQVEGAQQDIQNETMRQIQLQYNIEEIGRCKQKYQTNINDLQILNQSAKTKFNNLESIQYLSKQNVVHLQKDLNHAKSGLNEYNAIISKYREKQMDKIKKNAKIKKSAEDVITYDMMRIEDMEKENELLEEEIVTLIENEQEIINKRSESKQILNYIDSFNRIQFLFFSGPTKKEQIQSFYQKSQNDNTITYTDNNSNSQTYSPPTPAFMAKKAKSNSQTQEESRMHLITTVNKFAEEHPNCAQALVDKMIKLYNKYFFRNQELSNAHTLLLNQKQKFKLILMNLNEKIKTLKLNNSFIEKMKSDPQFENEIFEQKDAIDSGLIHLNSTIKLSMNQKKRQINRSSSCETDPTIAIRTTVNILKNEDMQIENEQMKKTIDTTRKFVFNFFSNYCESNLRFCQIILLTYKMAEIICPIQLQVVAKNTIAFIHKTWSSSQNLKRNSQLDESSMSKQSEDSDNSVSRAKSLSLKHTKSTQLAIEEALGVNHTFFKQILQEKYTLSDIKSLFAQIFSQSQEQQEQEQLQKSSSRPDYVRFYELLKQERIVWVFSDIYMIKKYLQKQNEQKIGSQAAFDGFEELHLQSIENFKKRLFEFGDHIIEILKVMKESSRISLREIKKIFNWFDIKQTESKVGQRENEDILTSRINAIKKSLNYQKNLDPLAEDLIILEKEQQNDGVVVVNSPINHYSESKKDDMKNATGNEDIKKSREQQKEDFKQEQISKLIDYIKNAQNKNTTKRVKFNQDTKQQQQQQSDQLQTGSSSNNATSLKQTLSLQSQQQSQQQGIIQQQVKLSQYQSFLQSQQLLQLRGNENSTMNNIMQSDDVAKYIQLHKSEENKLIEEREKIKNITFRHQEEERRKQDELNEQKNNKFFVNDCIAKINQRLIDKSTQQQKQEKAVRQISDNYMILSKVERLDKNENNNFESNAIAQNIEDEKSNMIRQLSCDLITSDLHYMKSNASYQIRQHITQQQSREHQLQFNLHLSLLPNNKNRSLQINNSQASFSNANNSQSALKTQLTENSTTAPGSHTTIKKRSITSKNKQPQDYENNKTEEVEQQRKTFYNNSSNLNEQNVRPNSQSFVRRRSANQSKYALNKESDNSDIKREKKYDFFEQKKQMKKSQSSFFHTKSLSIAQLLSDDKRSNNKQERKYANNDLTSSQLGFKDNNSGFPQFHSSSQQFYNNNYETHSARTTTPQESAYSQNNMKFYERYIAKESDAFFDQILNPNCYPQINNLNGKRPSTQPYPSARNHTQSYHQSNSNQLKYFSQDLAESYRNNNKNNNDIIRKRDIHTGSTVQSITAQRLTEEEEREIYHQEYFE